MAEANIKATVSIEAVLHSTFTKFAQEIADEYGVRVSGVGFGWQEMRDGTFRVVESLVETKSGVTPAPHR